MVTSDGTSVFQPKISPLLNTLDHNHHHPLRMFTVLLLVIRHISMFFTRWNKKSVLCNSSPWHFQQAKPNLGRKHTDTNQLRCQKLTPPPQRRAPSPSCLRQSGV